MKASPPIFPDLSSVSAKLYKKRTIPSFVSRYSPSLLASCHYLNDIAHLGVLFICSRTPPTLPERFSRVRKYLTRTGACRCRRQMKAGGASGIARSGGKPRLCEFPVLGRRPVDAMQPKGNARERLLQSKEHPNGCSFYLPSACRSTLPVRSGQVQHYT